MPANYCNQMKTGFKYCVFILLAILLHTFFAGDSMAALPVEVPAEYSGQCFLVSCDDNAEQAKNLHNERIQILFDKADQSSSKLSVWKSLFPIILSFKKYGCPKKKEINYFNYNTAYVIPCPITHYIYGQRKILI